MCASAINPPSVASVISMLLPEEIYDDRPESYLVRPDWIFRVFDAYEVAEVSLRILQD